MNHCYRLVFNSATHIWQAVAETAKSHTKSGGKSAAVVLLPILILGISNVKADPAPNALPTGGQVVSGQSIITQNGNLLNIQQTTQKSIINWTTFNIGASSHVNYDQLNPNSISLNRVLSADPSAIFGKLTSNGQVWLINPNGILFGQSAQVNVGGLLASTLNIADDDFLSSNYKFTGSASNNNASVVNMGNIVASNGGYVAMLAPEVRNEGVISALQGNVSLAAGDAMTLDFNGSGLINVQVDSANINTLVENKNLIKVGNGQVLMSTRAADGLMTSVINNSGRIEADSMVVDGGVVRLTGAKTVINSGVISAQSTAGKGGIVHMLGENVAVMDAGSINASGKTGGGTILVGGDAYGLVGADQLGNNANFQNANKTFISQNAKLTADATDTGNGGKVIVWADDITRYYGSISAKGGALSGNGGFVEVSGKRLLNFLGGVDLSAARGVGGNLLLDPLNITLSLGADSNTAGFTVPGDLTEAFADDAGLNSVFNVGAGGSFSGIAAGSTITLQATNDINVNSAFNVATATGSANNSLVLQANNNINVNAAVTTTGTGAITMAANADNDINGGDVVIAAAISAQSGGVTLSGVNITRTAGDITSTGASGFNGGNINMTATGAIALGGATVSNNGGSSFSGGGNAGNINISAGTGFSMAGAIISGGAASTSPNAGGNGGNVAITSATDNVSTGAITTNGGNAGAGIAHGSNAGNISVVATAGNVSTGALTARTGSATGTGASGAVASVTVSGVNVNLVTIDTSGQANGNGGAIKANATGILTLNGAVNSSGGTVITGNAGKNAGAIDFTGNSMASGAGGAITASGSNGSGADQAGGNGAAVSLTATGGAIDAFSTNIIANGGNGVATNAAGGNAGSISIAVAGNLTTFIGALTARTGAGIGAGANSTQGFISVNNTSAAGTIATGAINTSGQANGHGGNISVIGNGAVTVGGTVSSSGGTSTGTRAGRNAGNITVTGTIRAILNTMTASGGAGIGANQAGGNAGVVSITGADTLYTQAITTSTGASTGAGAGGVAASITLSASRVLSTALSTAAGAGGVGGNVNITTTGATTSSIASINANTNGAINMNVADTLTVSGVIAGTGTTLSKTGTGTVILAGSNTYTGATTVTAGQLQIGNGALAGSIMNAGGIANSGTVIFNRSDAHSYGGAVSGTGVVVKDGAGVFTLSGANTYTGATNILAGTLLDSASIPNSSAVNVSLGATLNLNNIAEIVGSIAGAGNIIMGTAALTSGQNNLSTNFSGVISGTGGNFNKQGTGTLTLSGNNTYTGLTQVQAGTLSAASINALGATGAGTTVTSGATLNVDNVTLAAEAITISGNGVGGVGALTGTGAATVTGNVITAAASRIGTTSAASLLTISGAVYSAANAINIAGAGDVTATNAANDFGSVSITGAKNVSLVDANNIAFTTSTLTGNLTAQALGNVTLTNAVSTTGGDITLAGANFINNAGASALSASGRWLVYSAAPATNIFGGLLSGNQAIWNTSYATAITQTGNRYVFTTNPSLTVTSTNQTKTYGQNGAPIVANAFTATGFINAATFGNVFTQDTIANSLSGSATSTGSVVTANVGSYAIDVSPITATTGYTLVKNSTGNLIVNPAALVVTANNQTKTYGQTFNFAGTEFTSTGLQNAETIGSATLTSAGAIATASVAGSPYAITASNATGGSFNAANYTITYANGSLAVNPAALVVTANNQTKTYGQTFNFAGTEFTTSALQNGETISSVSLTSAGAVNNANVASYAITGSAAIGGGGFNATNYVINYVDGAMTVNPAIIDLSGTRTYNATTAFNAGAFGAINGVLGQTLNLAGTGSVASANAGAAQTLTTGTLALTNGTGLASNYTLTGGTHTGTITQASLNLNAVTDTKTYDGNTNSTGVVNTAGLFGTDSVTGLTQSFVSKNVLGVNGSTLNVNGGFTVNDGNGGNNYTVATNSTTGTINPLTITGSITADNKVYDGNNTATIATRTLTGAIGGDDVTYTGGTATFADKNADTGKIVTGIGLGLSGIDAGNYTVNNTGTTTANISRADISAVTGITGNNKVYDATTAASLNSGAAAYTGIIGGDILTVAAATGTFVDANAGLAKTVSISGISLGGADAGNYNLLSTTASTTADISKAALSVTANNATKIQGNPNPPFSSVISGFVGGETSAVLIGALGHNTPAIIGSPAGNYAITPFGLNAANYDITFVDGVLTVNASANPAARGVRLNLAHTRPEQALQTCGAESANSAMIIGLDAFGANDVEYKEYVSQPQIGGVVANALVSPACLKI